MDSTRHRHCSSKDDEYPSLSAQNGFDEVSVPYTPLQSQIGLNSISETRKLCWAEMAENVENAPYSYFVQKDKRPDHHHPTPVLVLRPHFWLCDQSFLAGLRELYVVLEI